MNDKESASEILLFKKKKRFYLFILRETGKEGKGEGEKHQCVVASHVPQLGTWPITQVYALTRNQTDEPLVCRQALNPLSHTSQG